MEREYTIEIKEGAVSFLVPTPKRIALPLQKKVENKIIKEIRTPTDWCAIKDFIKFIYLRSHRS